MLDSVTKRRIDTCRDILVGKVPDPKSQVEQITIALIYKFMDDMDAEAEELGGKRAFFTGEFEKYGWAKLMAPAIGGFDRMNLYSEAMSRMRENPGIPALFREIFKNAYLPFRDPETLRMFLKEIGDFHYDHSEKLGDAFEYLLSVLGSQGDAGQFRTPRHIIDFIVEVVSPQKHESILDPACGTAGFLISSYKHILKQNHESGLSAPERARLAENLRGYDISPDMVRLSLVNLYLHGFAQPKVEEYDTLTSDDKWNEYADVILANPPFMSPKGGIKPHKGFSVQSNRSEVLFVDYIAEHLTPNGRAGIIVPEGIIFQGGTAYKSLRELLVKKYLVAVVSLPAGVFQPYSGVKTSILLLDKGLAKTSDSVLFLKIDSDGFGLGAQRRAVEKDDLIEARGVLAAWGESLREGGAAFAPAGAGGATNFQVVAKAKIAESGDYNLSGDRYRNTVTQITDVEWAELSTVAKFFKDGDWIESKDQSPQGIRLVQTGNVGVGEYLDKPKNARFINEETFQRLNCTEVVEGDVLVSRLPDPVGRACFVPYSRHKQITAVDCSILRFDKNRLLPELFVAYTKCEPYYKNIEPFLTGASRSRISRTNLGMVKIPLPPLSIQQEIVAEIEGYQKIIDGARQVVEHYKPRIDVRPEWPMTTIGEACQLINGKAFNDKVWEKEELGGYPIIRIQNLNNEKSSFNYFSGEVKEDLIITPGTLLFSWSGSRGTSFGPHIWQGPTGILNQHIFRVNHSDCYIKGFLYLVLKNAVGEVEENLHGGVGLVHITKGNLERINIPLPDLETQRAIVAEIEAEQRLVAASKELVGRFEAKIQAVVGRVWGE